MLPYEFNIISYFAITPLLVIIYHRNFKYAILLCALAGFITALFGFGWVYSYKPHVYPLTIIFMIFFFSSFAALTHFFYHRMKYLSLFVAPAVWIGLMLLLDLTRYGSYIFEFSMYNPMVAPLIWIVGGRGITFLVILLNSAIAEFTIKRTKKKATAVAVILVIIVSCFFYSSLGKAKGEPFKVTLVQGNFDKPWKWRQTHVKEIFDIYSELSEDQEGLIVWPEYALPVDITFYYPLLFKELQDFVKKTKTYFVIGSLFYDEKTKDHYDVALLFNPDGELSDYYKSAQPAFFNERTLIGDEGIEIFEIDGKKAGVMVCAEETGSKVARIQTKKGAQFLIALVNNQGLGRGIYLGMLYARLRAAENYKYLVRAANTGVTQVVNPYGKANKIKENKRKILIDEIRLNEHKTFYTKYGNAPLYLATILLLICVKKRRIGWKKKQSS